jgi:chloramphenicol 3-O phosphotransferase
MKLPQLILLNGTSSSGKTSIARALQEQLAVVYLNISIDCVLYALPPSDLQSLMNGIKIERDEYDYPQMVRGFHAAIAGLLATGNRLIVDNAMTKSEWRVDFDAAVAAHDILRIGVLCDLEIAKKRETARRDRAPGTAAAEFPLVHANMTYDLTVDTSVQPTGDCVASIIQWLSTRESRWPINGV